MIRFGIIGTGGIAGGSASGGGHAPALQAIENACFHSVLSRDDVRGDAFIQKYGGQKAYTDLSAFLSDPELDAVIVASPDNLHASHVLACAAAKKHILVEKPMAVTDAECQQIVDACQANQIKLTVGFHSRWHVGHRALHQKVVQDHILGELRHIRVQWTFSQPDASNWRARSELGTWWSLAATGIHCIDLIHWFAGDRRIDTVNCVQHSKAYGAENDETAMMSIVFEDGLTAELTTSVLFESPTRIELYGTEGFALCHNTLGRKGEGDVVINNTAMPFIPVNPFIAQLDNFVAVIEGRVANEVDEYVGARAVDTLIRATT